LLDEEALGVEGERVVGCLLSACHAEADFCQLAEGIGDEPLVAFEGLGIVVPGVEVMKLFNFVNDVAAK